MPKRSSDYHSWLLTQLADSEEAASYLNAAIEDSHEMFLKALRNVAEAYGMAKVAEGAGRARETLYRTLSEEGNPRLDTLTSVLEVLGLRIAVQPMQETPPPTGTRLEERPEQTHQGHSIKLGQGLICPSGLTADMGFIRVRTSSAFNAHRYSMIAPMVSEVTFTSSGFSTAGGIRIHETQGEPNPAKDAEAA